MTSQVLTDQTSVAVFSRLLRAHSSLNRELSARLITEHGLTINDYEALLQLAHADELGLKRVDLAERLMLTPSGVTRLLDGLERDGWVRKGACESDARVTYAVLTDAGMRKLRECAPIHEAEVDRILGERLSDEEVEKLGELLERLSDLDDDCSIGD